MVGVFVMRERECVCVPYLKFMSIPVCEFQLVYGGKVPEKTFANPSAPIHLLGASAGCNDLDGLCLDPIYTRTSR